MSDETHDQKFRYKNNGDKVNGRLVPFVGKGFRPESRRWVGYLVFISIIAAMELGTSSGVISSLTLPKPSDVLATIIELYNSGMLFKHLMPSISRLIVGSLIGISLGITIGTLIGLFSYIRSGLVPLVAAIFPIPKINPISFNAIFNLSTLWFK